VFNGSENGSPKTLLGHFVPSAISSRLTLGRSRRASTRTRDTLRSSALTSRTSHWQT
jgi:hypothetical protein